MVAHATRTAPVDPDRDVDGVARAPIPGLVAVFSGRALSIPFPVGSLIGRDAFAAMGVEDDQMSREHLTIEATGGLAVADRGSRNGTFVDGDRVGERASVAAGAVVRAGRTLFVPVADVGAFERSPTVVEDDVVKGPSTTEVLVRARAMGQLGQLLLVGESGVGKEQAARAFHAGLGPKAPFVALNCATIQAGIAERLLFGAKRGTYTGAEQDAEGFIHAASGGTLFLDEVAELDLAVQAKLLRFLETREYFALGDVRPRRAEVRVCFATLRDLAAEVLARRFREDLYHRIATPLLPIPSLASRRDEIPFLIELVARRSGGRVKIGLAFVERALLARWPGNVRQLLRTVEAALVAAEVAGRTGVGASDLPVEAARSEPSALADTLGAEASDDEVRHAMEVSGGNVSVAARALGMHRSKLRRRLGKL